MSIQYDLYDTPDIQQTGDSQPLHPRVVFKGTVDQEEFLDRAGRAAGEDRGDQHLPAQSVPGSLIEQADKTDS